MSISIIPLVTVIVTTKNNSDTLRACLESIKKQDYAAIELIVVDNNSTDDTKVIAKEYTEHVFNKGPERSAQRNYAAKKARGEYILIIDSDMELSSSIATQCVAAIDGEHKAIIIPEESFGIGFWARCKSLERSFYIGIEWIEAPRFFDKVIYLKAGGYDEYIVGGEDWDLSVRVRKETDPGRVKGVIRHNEGKLSLSEIIESRKYYSKGFNNYYDKCSLEKGSDNGFIQALRVYKLFLSQPSKLLGRPVQSAGMLAMKTIEFATIGIELFKIKLINKLT